jgi:inorganic pyrophosphatase
LSQDGDPLDVLVLVYEPTFSGCIVPVRPIGVLRMTDDKGYDEKILAVPTGDRRFDDIFDLSNLHEHWLREIENFFATYKLLEEKNTELHGWEDAESARKIIAQACERHARAVRAEGST